MSNVGREEFMEEVQKFDCPFNKCSRGYRDKLKKANKWVKVAEKFNMFRSFRRHSQKSRNESFFLHYLISISNLLTNRHTYFLKCKQNCSKNKFIVVPKQV